MEQLRRGDLGHPPSIAGHASPGVGSVNSWWVEGDRGIVLIDAQRQASQAREVARVVAGLAKPVAAILLTHAHPDHVGGLLALRDALPETPIHATQRTAEAMRTDEGGLYALTRSSLGGDFAATLPDITVVLSEEGEARIAGLRFAHKEFGIGETVSACIFAVRDAGVAFVGDVVANGMTPWLLEGHTGSWLAQLDRVAAWLPRGVMAYPGHGAPAPVEELVAAQRDYLTGFRERVIEAAIGGHLSRAARQAVVAEMEQRYPGWRPVAGIPDLIARNVDGVANELDLTVAPWSSGSSHQSQEG